MSAQARGRRRWWQPPVLLRSLWMMGVALMAAALLAGAGSLSGASQPASWAGPSQGGEPARLSSAALPQAGAAAGSVAYFPFVGRMPAPTPPAACPLGAGSSYASLSPNPPPTDRPAAQHPDLNLSIRGWEPTAGVAGFVVYAGQPDPNAPQLASLFADDRVPAFSSLHRVRQWDWACDCPSGPIDFPPVTLLGMATAPGEPIRLPRAGYDIGSGYQALVLYAVPNRLTLKYTREDNVVRGYTIHLEGICVDPGLLSLYRSLDAAGRSRLPALRSGQVVGRARGSQILVSIRDAGSFMDPRSHDDWWQGR